MPGRLTSTRVKELDRHSSAQEPLTQATRKRRGKFGNRSTPATTGQRHTDGGPREAHEESQRNPKPNMSTRRYPHMEEGYINTRRKINRRYDWKPNTAPPKDGPDMRPSQRHKKEK